MKKGAGRPNLGKTETIKQRAITVYLPTEEMLGQWKAEAGRHDLSLSSFITEVVDNAIRKSTSGVTPREELEKKLNDALSELGRLKERLDLAESALKRADETIADYRGKLSKAVPVSLDAGMTSKLVALFLEKTTIETEDIAPAIGVKLDDGAGMTRVRESLDFLKVAGLVENRLFDWRWKGGGRHKPRVAVKVRGPKRLH